MQKVFKLPSNKRIIADIFIPTTNRKAALLQCLDSLNSQTKKTFRVIIIGQKSDKEIFRLIEKYKCLKIVYLVQKQRGLIGAANEALKISRAPIFVRIDDDVILDPLWFSELTKTFVSNRKIGGVTGPTIMSKKGIASRDLTNYLVTFSKSNNIFHRLIGWIYLDLLYEGRIFDVSTFLPSGVFTIGSNFKSSLKLRGLLRVNNLEACNWSARTKLLKKVGGFDEIYVKGLGDYHEADAALKIKSLGYYLIFNPRVKLQHNVESGHIPKARPAPYYRIQNFIIFYFRFFRIKNLSQLTRFSINLFLQNCYFLFRFITTGNIYQLTAIIGTLIGIMKVIFIKKSYSVIVEKG